MTNWSEVGNKLTTTDIVEVGTTGPQSTLHSNGVLTVSQGTGTDSRITLGLGPEGFSHIKSAVVQHCPHALPLTNGLMLSFSTFPVDADRVVQVVGGGPSPWVSRIERLTITADGNIGVDTTNPLAKLDVRGHACFQGLISDNNATMTGVVALDDPGPAIVGDVTVTGDVLLLGADCAEEFDVAVQQHLEPRTVVVIDQQGSLIESSAPYDRKVAGVVSGAGTHRPALILDKQTPVANNRVLIALLGKIFCKVDAQYSPIVRRPSYDIADTGARDESC